MESLHGGVLSSYTVENTEMGQGDGSAVKHIQYWSSEDLSSLGAHINQTPHNHL